MAQAIPIGLMIAGTALSAGGSIIGGNSQSKALKSEATQFDASAGQYRASSQREAMDETRQGDLSASRVLALAAASGAGASDPTVINLIGNLSGESQYRALTALYNGDQKGRAAEAEAASRRAEAKGAKTAGILKAAGSIISSGSSLYDRYGGPKATASKATYG
jgi:hypothetical protein